MSKIFKNKVAVITGAATGIGRATALAFAHEGAHVVLVDVDDAHAQETLRMIEAGGAEGLYIHVDVSHAKEVQGMMEKTLAAFGRIDIAVNNAGIEGKSASIAECTEENFDKIIATNLKGVWLCMKYEIPHMLKNKSGAIVNMSSVAGLVGFEGLSAYTASKHAVIGLTKTAALEYAKQGIRVNSVCPGAIATPMLARIAGGEREAEKSFAALEPVGRIGKPEEIADAVLWLCSEKSSFVTGQAIAVDGGWVAR